MSWGCQKEIPEIKTAIRNAFHKGVTIFAAASNDGRISTVTFPANLRQVICVKSCDGSLFPFRFNPSPKPDTNIAIIGECLEAAWPMHLCQDGEKTALKSGINCNSNSGWNSSISSGICTTARSERITDSEAG